MSTTLSKNWTNPDVHLHNRDIDHEEVLQRRNRRSFLPSKPRQLSLHNDGHGNNSSCSRRNCGSSTVSSTTAPRNCTTCKPKYRSPCQCTATGESLCFSEKHANCAPRCTTGMSGTGPRAAPGISTIGCTVCTVSTRLCPHNRNSQPLSMT